MTKITEMHVVNPDHTINEEKEQVKQVNKVRFGRKYNYENGKRIETNETDYQVILLSPTGRREYTTMIKQIKGHINMYSQGIEISNAEFKDGKFIIEFDLKNITLADYARLQKAYIELQIKSKEILNENNSKPK